MILLAEFESKDCLPPRVWNALQIALKQLFANWGIDLTLRIERQAELATYQRFWEWCEQERARHATEEPFPATPADAEVK